MASRQLLREAPLICSPLKIVSRPSSLDLVIPTVPVIGITAVVTLGAACVYIVFANFVLPAVGKPWDDIFLVFLILTVASVTAANTYLNRRSHRFGVICSLSRTDSHLSVRHGLNQIPIDASKTVQLVCGRGVAKFGENRVPMMYVHCFIANPNGDLECVLNLAGSSFPIKSLTGEGVLRKFFCEFGCAVESSQLSKTDCIHDDELWRFINEKWKANPDKSIA